MNNLLNQLKLVISKYEEIEKINGTNFNIFSILNMERNEVKTHSNFIYELLNKNGSHGKGNLFLKLFLKEVLEIKDYGSFEEIKSVQEDLTEEKRRIDFTIQTSNYQIGIEMKIDARDQESQMYDYDEELKKRRQENQNLKLYYLTLDGKKPSENSISKDDNRLNEKNYELISFENHIVKWIDLCIKECATSTIVREALVQYLNLVKTITNQSNSKGEIMEMVEILSTGNNLKVFLEAEEAVKETKIKLQLTFWENLIEKLDKTEYKFVFESQNDKKEKNIDKAVNRYYEDKQLNKDYGYTYYLDNKDKNIYYSIWVDDELYYEIGSIKEDDSFNIMKEKIKGLKYDKYHGFGYFKEEFNFANLLTTPNVFELFDEKKLNIVTDNIIREISKTIEEMKHHLEA